MNGERTVAPRLEEARARLLRGLVPGIQGLSPPARRGRRHGPWAAKGRSSRRIAALVAIGATASRRFARSVELTLGVALGILAGDLVRAGLGHSGPSIGLAVFLAVGFARLIDERPLAGGHLGCAGRGA